MNEEIKKMLLELIDKAHEKDNLRNIGPNRDRLVSDLLSKRRYELRHGKITNHNGVLQDLKEDVELLLDTSPYIGRKSSAADDAKFISKFAKPSAEAKKKIADEVEGVLKKLSKLNSIVARDQENYDRSLYTLSKYLVYETDDDGQIVFAKLNESGLISEKRLTFDDIKNALAHLIDDQRTQFARDLRESKLRALAKELVGDLPKNAVRTSVDPIKKKLEVIKKNELLSEFTPKQLPRISRAEINKEVMRREATIRGMGELEKIINGGGMPLHALTRIAKREVDSLDDFTTIELQLKSIQPRPVAKYEGLSYE